MGLAHTGSDSERGPHRAGRCAAGADMIPRISTSRQAQAGSKSGWVEPSGCDAQGYAPIRGLDRSDGRARMDCLLYRGGSRVPSRSAKRQRLRSADHFFTGWSARQCRRSEKDVYQLTGPIAEASSTCCRLGGSHGSAAVLGIHGGATSRTTLLKMGIVVEARRRTGVRFSNSNVQDRIAGQGSGFRKRQLGKTDAHGTRSQNADPIRTTQSTLRAPFESHPLHGNDSPACTFDSVTPADLMTLCLLRLGLSAAHGDDVAGDGLFLGFHDRVAVPPNARRSARSGTQHQRSHRRFCNFGHELVVDCRRKSCAWW